MARLSFVVTLPLLSLLLSFVNGESYPTSTYKLVKDFGAGTSSFFSNFNFFTGADPTDGDVNYVSYATATADQLAYNNGGSWFGPDYLTNNSSPRNSVRLQSVETFNNVLIIAEFEWVPGSVCATWPAFWTANIPNWPNGGEIDIYEGVNNQEVNHYSFHVGGTCSQSGEKQSGQVVTSNCNYDVASQSYNAGCGGWATSTETYGDGMNNVGGGVYAMDWRTSGIRIWYFNPNSIPSDITKGAPTTANWGTPMADLPSTGCNIANNFYNHNIVFDIDFCGSWAGTDYSTSGCPGTCTGYVAENPDWVFWNSWFGITSLKVYQSPAST